MVCAAISGATCKHFPDIAPAPCRDDVFAGDGAHPGHLLQAMICIEAAILMPKLNDAEAGFSPTRKPAMLGGMHAELFHITSHPLRLRLTDFARYAGEEPGESRMPTLIVNGQTHNVEVEPDTPLLWVLRDTLGMTGTKYGCGIAQCGACTVHIDGAAVRSCSVQFSDVVGKRITTIEGLAENGVLHKVQKAWLEHDVPQCGYCQSGMIMAVADLLKSKPKPTDADIDSAISNICRCGTFQQVRVAIHAAANA